MSIWENQVPASEDVMSVRIPRKRGFTLIELMVVITIIAILAATIVVALQMAQAKAVSRACMARARAVASATILYSSRWDGWFHGDAHYYIKEFGYKLAIEEGYFKEPPGSWAGDELSQSYQYAQTIKDFVCPIQVKPLTTFHAARSSYRVLVAGQNIMGTRSTSNRTIVVKETDRVHPSAAGEGSLERHYVFADLHAEVGPLDLITSGYHIQIWASPENTPQAAIEIWNQIQGKENTYRVEPNWDTVWITDFYMDTTHFHNIMTNATPGQLNSFAARFDGYIEFPSIGVWELDINHDDGAWFWLDANGNGEVESSETYSHNHWSGNTYVPLQVYNITEATRYQYAIALENFPTNIRMQIRWSTGDKAKKIITSNHLFWDVADQ